jgi:hypothetical protein
MRFLVVLGPITENLGAFKVPLFLLSISVLLVIVLLSIDRFFRSDLHEERFKRGMNALLVLGSLSAAVGMLGQIMGIWYALAAIMVAADISPEIVYKGLQASFATTYFGFITFFIAFIFWLALNYLPEKKKS